MSSAPTDHARTGVSSGYFYANVVTLPNDFGLTSSSAPWMVGAGPGKTIEVIPAPTSSTARTITAMASDGTTATVSIYHITSDDGQKIVKES